MKFSISPERAEELILNCAGLVPNEILAKLTKWSISDVRKKQSENGKAHVLEISSVIKLNKAFQRTLPDAETLPFNMKERKQIAFLRQKWIAKRIGLNTGIDNRVLIIEELSRDIPNSIIAKLLKVSKEKVLALKQQLGLDVEKAQTARRYHAFVRLEHCPSFKCLNEEQEAYLKLEWQEAKKRFETLQQKRESIHKQVPELTLLSDRELTQLLVLDGQL